MKIQAAVLDRLGGPVRVETIDLDEPRSGEVLVKMGAAGVCHSDYHSIVGHSPADLPCVVGHEGAGEIIAIGPDVNTVRIGDRVALNWLPSCDNCFFCGHNQHHLCREITDTVWSGSMADGSSRLSHNGREIWHYSAVSTWADHMVVNARCCQPIPDEVPYDVAAIIGCAVATGVGAALHRGKVGPGDHVAVVGAGGVGLSTIMGAKLAGAETIIAIDRAADKEAMALELGATHFVAGDDNAVARVRALTGDRGADTVFEAVGNPALQRSWIEGVRPGGTLVLVGLSSIDATTEFVAADLARQEKTITGSYFAATDAGQAIRDLCTAYVQQRLPVDKLISKRLRLQDINEALDAMLTGAEGRVVITFD